MLRMNWNHLRATTSKCSLLSLNQNPRKRICNSKRRPNKKHNHLPPGLVVINCGLQLPSLARTSLDVFNARASLVIGDLDPATAKLAIGFTGPLLSAFGFLFVARIVMSWYPRLPVERFPYVIAYAPTEPILSVTRKVIKPVGGVDVTPVVWFGLISFLNEILVGPQGLLVLLSQKV
ncbi:hypothetical protein QJS10_CPA01g00108 [Acorus calamus]|uniref:Protein COFACTOR ASSEMBLY OF COMPLEX C SUBUNIT B CCB3, chloroplastic n=1 Tax=Acorus calamus TaxID=4465 RepID=A0AAV9FIY7_ACOCL|nr:hypothetical protein QJS10_CPA01g00108 [Acorus calamus]